jgi:hypothetical protein
MRRLGWLLILCAVCCSCRETAYRKPTFPVTGKILVDGQPVDQLAVRCLSDTGMDKEHPTSSTAFTDKEGNFQISTYEKSDGVPVGKYKLTVTWGQWNLMSMQYGGDKFNGKYDSVQNPVKEFEVKEGQPTDLGVIELTTK